MSGDDERQRVILDNIPDMAWLKDRESRYIAVNEAYIAACGLPESDILNKIPTDVWPSDWAARYIETDQEVVRTGQRKRYEESRYDKDGTLRWFDTIKAPIRNGHGDVVGTAGISRDITDRKIAEQELFRLNRLYTVLSKTNQAIVRIPQEAKLLKQVCKIAVRSGDLQMAWIGFFPNGSAGLKLATSYSIKRGALAGLSRHIGLWPDLDLPATNRRYRVCNDASASEQGNRHAQFALRHNFRSFAFFRLAHDDERNGIFALYSGEAGFFTKDIVQLLSALSADLSFALDSIAEARRRRQAEEELLESRSQLRELSAYLQSVREEERARISRELHDELGQTLMALKMGVEWVENRLGPEQRVLRDKLVSLEEIADGTVDAMRRIAADLRPIMLDELGLVSAVEWLLETFSERTGIAFEFLLDGPETDFRKEVSTTIFRILQESLTNASRHGKASRVKVELATDRDTVSLKITDNGKGIDAASEVKRKRLGLVGMRERTYILGGSLDVTSKSGAGTVVEARLPKQQPSSRETESDSRAHRG